MQMIVIYMSIRSQRKNEDISALKSGCIYQVKNKRASVWVLGCRTKEYISRKYYNLETIYNQCFLKHIRLIKEFSGLWICIKCLFIIGILKCKRLMNKF